jgi:hypothetical protein
MYEKRSQPVLPRSRYARRQLAHGAAAGLVVLASLIVGVLGYRLIEGMSWIDSLTNAAMILSGMGQVNELHTTGGKIFASCYALFSGAVFLVAAAVLLAPAVHRLLHHFHFND